MYSFREKEVFNDFVKCENMSLWLIWFSSFFLAGGLLLVFASCCRPFWGSFLGVFFCCGSMLTVFSQHTKFQIFNYSEKKEDKILLKFLFVRFPYKSMWVYILQQCRVHAFLSVVLLLTYRFQFIKNIFHTQ